MELICTIADSKVFFLSNDTQIQRLMRMHVFHEHFVKNVIKPFHTYVSNLMIALLNFRLYY